MDIFPNIKSVKLLSLTLISVLLSSCASVNPAPAPTPVVEPVAPVTIDQTPLHYSLEEYTAVKVKYATNRRGNGNGDFLPEINLSKDALSYGQEVVLIPFNRERGSFKDSHSAFFKILMKMGFKDEKDNPIISIAKNQSQVLSEKEFFESLKTENMFSKGDIFLFVHGFNVNFESSIKRAAQVSYDIDLNLQPIVFSWPSIGEMLKYERDSGRANDSAIDFKEFVSKLVASNSGKKIHILAHSMGSKVVIPALASLYSENPRLFRKRFGNIILAAPDFPRETFFKTYKDSFANFGRTTIYMSSDDEALKLSSSSYLADREMLGFSGSKGFFYPGIDSIDITRAVAIDDILGHSRYGNSSKVLGDMHHMIGKNLRANKRNGFSVIPPTEYWVLQP
ncbi:alpha/beta hydrolase [Pseudomonas gingeri NCPPB 3146 = LMG 5327]|uniref:Alpha/beta fold hydrolase n=2 Tax=Pseudomonas gingeri TaxID=117681 RepID=A0A7Y7XX60_9PSED|nr:alpha/beta hydrolase [Pseudomonas gingeri]NWC13929.1 alpha/beta fold hydrolase [Pseudomonas gingeri]PNQ88870.1 alpha/beta hydrolase [Pseudomonas gingeri NCPPB 3146 = LMG 5327]